MAAKALIMAGGTGGHIFPAMAVARELAERGWSIVWLGTARGMEAKLVPVAGYPLRCLDFSGVRGKGLLQWLFLPARLLVAFAQALKVIREEKPSVVLGMGGYVSVPAGLMAVLIGRPLVIHEQNAVAGMANRLLAQVSDRVLAAFDGAFTRGRGQWLKVAGVSVVGNPIRREIGAVPPPSERYAARFGPLRLLVVGGSLGAAALNRIVPEAIALLPKEKRPQVLHQTGEGKEAEVVEAYLKRGVEAGVQSFLTDMARHYAEADLVVCRAGALTVSELAVVGVPAVFVPYPHAVDDHQTENARAMAEAGAAWVLPQDQLDAPRLAEILAGCDRAKLAAMAEQAKRFGKPEAGLLVAKVCEELAR